MSESKKWTQQVYKFRQLIILIVMCVIFTIALPGKFLAAGNFVNILYAISLQGIMICGATFPVLLAGIDRTVSGTAALAGAMCCTTIVNGGFTPTSVFLGVVLGLGIGMLSGLFHGLVLSRFDIPAFLLTLATSEILYGLVQTVTHNQLINVMKADAFKWIGGARPLGIPMPVYILALCFLFTYIMLNKTVYGRHLYCVGGNREAAKLSGIKVKKVIIIAYIISGIMGRVFGRSSASGSGGRTERMGRSGYVSPDAGKKSGAALTFAAGDKVDHKTFGRGVVTAVDGDTIHVKFAKTGQTKKLLKDYAPIVKINTA